MDDNLKGCKVPKNLNSGIKRLNKKDLELFKKLYMGLATTFPNDEFPESIVFHYALKKLDETGGAIGEHVRLMKEKLKSLETA